MDDGGYQRLIHQDCADAAQRFHFELRAANANGDADRQVDQILWALNDPTPARPNALIVHPVRESRLLAAAAVAARLGVALVFLHRRPSYLNDLRAEYPRLPVFSVGPDHLEIGRIQALQLKALLPQGGEVVCIRGNLGVTATTLRFQGLSQVLEGSPFRPYSVTSDWTFAGGQRAMRGWLEAIGHRSPPAFAVVAHNDPMAAGAKQALADWAGGESRFKPSFEHVPVIGCDGTRRNELSASVLLPLPGSVAIKNLCKIGHPEGWRPEAEIRLSPSSLPDLQELTWSKYKVGRQESVSSRPPR